jgi:gamma-glutamyltranspeptidase / glutathione hydrolase
LWRLLFAGLIAAILCSCGAPSATPDNASREDGTNAEPTSSMENTSEETTSPGEPTIEETNGPPERTTVSDSEPEPRDGPATTNTATRPALGANGMVSSAHPLATKAGLGVLEDGGNAFDAAVAVSAALNVVEPMMSGVGGYGSVVVYDAGANEVRSIGANSRVPTALDPDVFYPPTPNYLANRRSALSVVTPGNLNVWDEVHDEYGELGWARLFEPAMKHAEEGFLIDERTAYYIGLEFGAFPAHAQEIYGSGGVPLAAGDRLVQQDLAGSLRLISNRGAGAVYGGELGEAMASEVQQYGGFLSTEDLRNNSADWRGTTSIDYRGGEVVTMGRPTTPWTGLVRLGVMSRFDVAASSHNSADYLHRYAEVTKRVEEERARYAGDPEVNPPPLDLLLSEEYWVDIAANVSRYEATPYEPPPSIYAQGTPSASASATASAQASIQQGHTTHFVVADREGNVVSATQTLGNLFGSRVMPEGTGIWLNDSLAWHHFDPRSSVPELRPGGLRTGGGFPVLVLRDGRPRVAIGTPGGRTINQTMPQMLMNLIDFDMDVQRAISSPRISFVEPYWLAVEGSMPARVRDELAARGHTISVDDPELGTERGLGNAHALTIEYDAEGRPARFTGGADPRGDGVAAGY